MIRSMTKQDIKTLQDIDKICFGTEHTRRQELMEAFINEGASLVYEEEGKVAGYIFNHILGSFAWFGTLGVHPDYRGKEIGKELVKEAISCFYDKFKVKNIGLVTMPYSGYNIGFYMKLGFKPKELALRLCKNIDMDSKSQITNSDIKVEIVDLHNETAYEEIRAEGRKISTYLYEGLDMSSELQIIRDSNMGTGFMVYEKNELVGFGGLRNKTVFNEESSCIHIRLLCLRDTVTSYKTVLNQVLNQLYEYGASKGYKQLFMDINTVYNDVCYYLLNEHNFKVDKSSLTLIMGDENFYNNINGLILFRTVS